MSAETYVNARVTRRFNASPEQVFDAWLEPEKVIEWMFPKGEIVRVEINQCVGGHFSFVDKRNGEEVDHTGEYLEIKQPNRLVFTWGIPAESPDFDQVSINIAPVENGSVLTLIHELHPDWAGYKSESENAWTIMLEAMDKTLS
ncbi:SRPBCC domain-containing protein [Alkalihalobacillus sp. AL-G]|uniref:SRPBCC family protein n=1 Tax=Alkalihalobacillus sp. AL-G TaxID=2926399 RepID=UPI00272C92F0|nr:SRPBCC domain-containing protein [Alkalihalobacillus sp. AL-G]WLD94653.1 SRPBCC domain-containing protein [Alkalihalobacillus sp. AL-G]